MRTMRELFESMMRHCTFYKATDGQWYMELGPGEHDERQDSDVWGPFASQKAAMDFLHNTFSNPGGHNVDDSGKKPVPKKGPNGTPLIDPKRW